MLHETKTHGLFISGILVFAVVVVIWSGWWLIMGIFETPAAAALAGDSFGVVNTLFSGLAFGGLIVTVLLQSRELALQRMELRLQREESEKARKELARSAKAQAAQIQVNAQLARTTALSALMDRAIGCARTSSVVKTLVDGKPRDLAWLDATTDLDRKLHSVLNDIEQLLQCESVNNDEDRRHGTE